MPSNEDYHEAWENHLKNQGTPKNKEAFPNSTGVRCFSPGMTLRDYFAAAALQGYRAAGVMYDSGIVADMAGADADAMLDERDE